MLPSTGYFKALNCPFYENGYCERPYCHFKHTRRDVSSTGTSESNQTVSKSQNASSSTVTTADKDVIEKLVSEAVKKVLADQNVTDTDKIVDKVVEGLKPKLVPAVLSSASKPELPTAQSSKCVYNPTPIAELKKRHISIASYVPTRESKAVRRKSPDVERPWMDVIRNITTDTEPKQKKIKYTPTAISQIEAEKNSIHTYVPTLKSDSSLNLYNVSDDEYIPENKRRKERYHPKSKKRREEYVPRKPKIPLKDEQRLEDDSFDVLDELLGGSNSNQSSLDNEDTQDYLKTKTHQSNTDHDDIDIMEIDLTKDENKSKESEPKPQTNIDSSNFNQANEVQPLNRELLTHENKSKDKQVKEELKQEDIKQSKYSSKNIKAEDDEDIKNKTSKEDSLKHTKIKDDDSKQSKNKDKEKDKERSKEKDKHKHSTKSNVKDQTSSSKDSRNKEKDTEKSKDSKSSSSHSSRSKDSKPEKKKSSSSSRDFREDTKKNSKSKSKHKYDKKDKHKSRSSSSERKKKSSKSSHKSSSRHDSHSSHKSSKPREKSTESEDYFSENQENKSDQEREKYDVPEYEEFSPMYDEHLLEASDSEHDVEQECLKIFQEYEVSDHPKDVTSKASTKLEHEEPEEIVKKRVAHPAAESNIIKSVGPSEPPKRLPSAQARMYERWRQTKELAAEKAVESKVAQNVFQKGFFGTTSNDQQHQHNGNGRIRIAHVPYAKSLTREKEKVMEQAAKIAASKTTAQTSKAGARVAHVPQVVPQLTRPEPLHTAGTQKFSLNVRQFYVNAMQDICIQIYTNADDAAQRAVREEHTCYEKCKALNVYKNSCMLTVHRLRKEVDQKAQQPTTSFGSISHAAVLAGKVKGTYSVIKPKKALTDIKGKLLYDMLSKWILSEDELRENGYPRPHPDGSKGRAKLYVLNKRGQSTPSKVPNERYCCRCNKPYMVDKYGCAVKNENCIYHYARKYTFRGESKYMCCKQDGTSEGCCDAPTHVWDLIDPENLRGYVSTFDKGGSAQDVFSLDCEMCYTTEGLELTRVTVINQDCKVVYETLVKPSHPIIDYNTRFSGITEDDMKNVTTTLLDVQATFLSMFSSKTILIGHSLESDFKALKLLHDTVVDTSVMFPHKNGPPFKRALKNLCSEHLRKIIQNEVSGHDSKEDAIACMELVLWKVKEEAKLL